MRPKTEHTFAFGNYRPSSTSIFAAMAVAQHCWTQVPLNVFKRGDTFSSSVPSYFFPPEVVHPLVRGVAARSAFLVTDYWPAPRITSLALRTAVDSPKWHALRKKALREADSVGTDDLDHTQVYARQAAKQALGKPTLGAVFDAIHFCSKVLDHFHPREDGSSYENRFEDMLYLQFLSIQAELEGA